MKTTIIRRLAAILITVSMLTTCMPFSVFAENEPATPTDLAPAEEKQEEPGEGEPAEGETQEESGKEGPAEGETPNGESTDGDPADEDENGEGTEGTKEELPELHYGQSGLRGTLKAGQEYKAVLHPEYSWNILVTLKVIPKGGQVINSTDVQIRFDGDKKELTQIENEDSESTGISLQFGIYAAKEKEHTISITVPFDADFILTAVKQPKQETEKEDEEETGDNEEIEDSEDGEELAGGTGNPEAGTETEEPADGEGTGDEDVKPDDETEDEAEKSEGNGVSEEPVGGEELADMTDEEQIEAPDDSGETEAPATGEEAGNGEQEESADDSVKIEPATPTDLAPVEEETLAQPTNEGMKTGNTQKTESGKTEKQKKKIEEPEDLPTDEEMLALGYYGIQVVMSDGADIFNSMEEGAEPAAHIDAGEVCWIRPTEDATWAVIYRADEKNPAQYLRWEDVVINQKPEIGEEEEELPARSIEISSTLWGMKSIPLGQEITMTAELINFLEDDICTFQWQYLDEVTDTYIDIDGANELTYVYTIDTDNFFYTWRLVVIITNDK